MNMKIIKHKCIKLNEIIRIYYIHLSWFNNLLNDIDDCFNFKIHKNYKLYKNMELLDYLYNNNYIDNIQYKIGSYIRNSFRKQKFLKTTVSFNPRVRGGKIEDKMIEIISENKQWFELEKCFNINHISINFVEKFICLSATLKQIAGKSINNLFIINQNIGLFIIINNLIKILNMTNNYFKNDKKEKINYFYFETIIEKIKELVKKIGKKKTAKETGMSFNTLIKILNGNKNIKLSNLEKLITYLKL